MAAVETKTTRSAPTGALLLLVTGAALAGAAGVALAAVAAHRIESPALSTAATMLMVHAAAVLSVSALASAMRHSRPWLLAGALMLGAVSLFSGGVVFHAVTGAHLFPYAAPIGGAATILSWLVLAGLAMRDYFTGGTR